MFLKKGFTIHRGYKLLRRGGKYVAEHRLIAEKEIGRKLRSFEVVHHRNERRSDNRPVNLQVMNRAEHRRLHHKLKN